jgi:hypothetical protein
VTPGKSNGCGRAYSNKDARSADSQRKATRSAWRLSSLMRIASWLAARRLSYLRAPALTRRRRFPLTRQWLVPLPDCRTIRAFRFVGRP